MNKLYELIVHQKKTEEAIRRHKAELHKQFVRIHKKEFKYLDILVAVIILLNFGALFTTNALVMKKAELRARETGQEIRFYEANPAVAATNDFIEAEDIAPKADILSVMLMVLQHALKLMILLSIYIFYRRNCITEQGLSNCYFVLFFYLIILGMDFFNDAGFFVGKAVFG